MDEFAEIGLGSVVVGGVVSFLGMATLGTALIPVGIALVGYGLYSSNKSKAKK